MIGEGEVAPAFTLPAVVDGAFEEVSLSEYLGDDIVVLAFYPADFNPCCSEGTTDLDELDLFRMQKDVSVLGISADSVYSHRAFADEYDLHVPLLADVTGEVAREYGVAREDSAAGYLLNRAVVVVDPGGEVQYAWRTDDLTRTPPVDDIREAVEAVGGASTAEARYRVGHAHYVEGRRAFTRAMRSFEDREWMMAQGYFDRAQEEFQEAADQFDTAVRFSEGEQSRTHFDRAEKKAESLWQASEWLSESASAYASGEGKEGQQLRADAESSLAAARDIAEPTEPDEFPLDADPNETDGSIPPSDDVPAESLEEAATPPETERLAEEMNEHSPEPADATAEENDESEGIDEEELEEITAELEEQTERATREHNGKQTGDDATDEHDEAAWFGLDGTDGTAPDADGDADKQEPDAGEVEGELAADEIELDLADPTEGEERESDGETDGEEREPDGETDEDEEVGSGDHGVPDSL